MTTTLDSFFTALGCYSSYLLIEQIKFDSKRPDLDIKENLERPLGYYTKMAEKKSSDRFIVHKLYQKKR